MDAKHRKVQDGPDVLASLVGDKFWGAGCAAWAIEMRIPYDCAKLIHSLWNCERIQAWIARKIKLNGHPELIHWSAKKQNRYLAQALEAEVGRRFIEEGAERAVDWVKSILSHPGINFYERILAICADPEGRNIPGELRVLKIRKGTYQATRGNWKASGFSEGDAKHALAFAFYFGD